jgi:hypothetical protein
VKFHLRLLEENSNVLIKISSLRSKYKPMQVLVFARGLEKWQKGSSAETHLQSSKTRRGFYVDQELSIFVKIFELYLVSRSL